MLRVESESDKGKKGHKWPTSSQERRANEILKHSVIDSMSAAAAGGRMSGSDGYNGSGEKKRKGIFEISDTLPLADEDGDEDDDEKEAESALDCLASLEASLPMKRGLSSHYNGRSKSFGNLTDLSIEDSKDLGKKEHALHKRCRLLIAHEYRDKQLHGSGANSNITHASSKPAFLSDHHKNEDEEEEEDNREDNKKGNNDKDQKEEGRRTP